MDVVVFGAIAASLVAGTVVIWPTVQMTIGLAPHIYANTRCSAKLAQLLPDTFTDNLLQSVSYEESLSLLEDSYYRVYVEKSRDFVKLSSMLNQDLYLTYRWLETIVPENMVPIIKTLRIKFEIGDIKELFNNLKNKITEHKLPHVQDENLKLKLENTTDFASLMASFEGTEYSTIFANKNLTQLDSINNELDKFYFEKVFDVISASEDEKAAVAFKEYFSYLVDLINLKLTLRRIDKKSSLDLLDHGRISKESLEDIEDLNAFENLLSQFGYNENIVEYTPFEIENSVYKYMKKASGLINSKHSLKSGSVVRYIMLKEIEIRNVNIILKLKSDNFNKEEIQKVLVL